MTYHQTAFSRYRDDVGKQPYPEDHRHTSELIGNVLELPDGVTASRTALVMPPDLSLETWEAIGEKLQKAETSIQWWLGDWWHFGDHKYGERAKATAKGTNTKSGAFRYTFETLMNYGWVAGKVATSRRREVLSFSHHQEVAPLDPEAQEKWLAEAVRRKLTVKSLRQAMYNRELREAMLHTDLQKMYYAASYISQLLHQAARYHDQLYGIPKPVNPQLFRHLSAGDLADLKSVARSAATFWTATADGLDTSEAFTDEEWRSLKAKDKANEAAKARGPIPALEGPEGCEKRIWVDADGNNWKWNDPMTKHEREALDRDITPQGKLWKAEHLPILQESKEKPALQRSLYTETKEVVYA